MNGQGIQESRCPWCREPVRPRARVCPHCARWQGRLAAWACQGLLSRIAWGLMLLGMLGANYWVSSAGLSSIRAPFRPAPLTGQVRVIDSEMTPGSLDGKPVIAIVGRLENEAEDTWAHVALEVQFSDAAGKLVDVERLYPRPQTVPPHGESAFCVAFAPELPAERYATHKVFVRGTGKPDWPF